MAALVVTNDELSCRRQSRRDKTTTLVRVAALRATADASSGVIFFDSSASLLRRRDISSFGSFSSDSWLDEKQRSPKWTFVSRQGRSGFK